MNRANQGSNFIDNTSLCVSAAISSQTHQLPCLSLHSDEQTSLFWRPLGADQIPILEQLGADQKRRRRHVSVEPTSVNVVVLLATT